MKRNKTRYCFSVILPVIFVFIFACSGNRNKQKKVPDKEPVIENVDKNALFDGKTLSGWKVTEFGTQGPVYVSDGKIVLNYGDGCTGITWEKEFPKVNYEVTLEAQKTSGNDFFCGITFPVKEEFCSLIVGGWGGPVVGLSCIDGKDASDNSTKILKRFDKNVWYKIKLKVTDKKITAWIDDEKMVDFDYTQHELYVRPEVTLSRPFGICSWITTAELRNIQMVQL
ncbi:MAG TPA: DUF1080 domain-containing protein [Draconibacterium sp.]|nr:DUF1080 domain-containing protein [Draconibacterium sp.]